MTDEHVLAMARLYAHIYLVFIRLETSLSTCVMTSDPSPVVRHGFLVVAMGHHGTMDISSRWPWIPAQPWWWVHAMVWQSCCGRLAVVGWETENSRGKLRREIRRLDGFFMILMRPETWLDSGTAGTVDGIVTNFLDVTAPSVDQALA